MTPDEFRSNLQSGQYLLFGYVVALNHDLYDEHIPPADLALFDEIIENFDEIKRSTESAVADYAKSCGDDISHFCNPSLMFMAPEERTKPNEWCFCFERDDFEEFGLFVEFVGVGFHELYGAT